jgi:hypothetical protein
MFDALSSLTVISGVTFRWDRDPPPNLLIDSVFWQGCFINRTTFDRTVFHACDLRGTVFAGCVFKGVTFFDCILDGAMFLGCSFSTHVSDDPCEFDGGLVGSALFADCEFGEVRFKDTVLDGSIFKKNQIHRSIDIVNSSLEVVVLLECEYVGENTAERRGVLRIAASDVFCTRIISTPFGNKRRPRVVIQSDCEVFPVGLRESFETPPNTKLSKDRIDVVKMLETKYLLPVSQDERTSHKVATPQ